MSTNEETKKMTIEKFTMLLVLTLVVLNIILLIAKVVLFFLGV